MWAHAMTTMNWISFIWFFNWSWNQLNLSKLLEVFWYYTIVLDWEVAENVYPSVETKKLSPIINITLWFLGEENCPQV